MLYNLHQYLQAGKIAATVKIEKSSELGQVRIIQMPILF